MAITHVSGGGTGSSGANTTSLTATLASEAADDFAIIHAFSDQATTVPTLAVTDATGWTTLRNDNPTAGRNRVDYIFYKKLTSASETNPVITIDQSFSHAVTWDIFRGVDTTTPFDQTEVFADIANTANPDPSAITTVTDDACILVLHGAVQSAAAGSQVAGAPAGYTLGGTNTGTDADEFMANAYLLLSGTAGVKDPGVFTHTSDAGADNSVYTLALRPAVGGSSALPGFTGTNRGIGRGIARGVS